MPTALLMAMPVELRCSKLAPSVGQLAYAKGFDVLLRGLAFVVQRYPDWRWTSGATEIRMRTC